MKTLTKCAAFTDIHWGAKANSPVHNQDCLDFIDWFCANVQEDSDIDHICFLGDWFENRSAVNVATLDFAYRGAKRLNDLGLPVFFVIGNHDLYHRHTREIYSTSSYAEFSNFQIISEPTIIKQIGDGAMFSPYLFGEEYPQLAQFLKYKTWWGHFEFKGFIVTGYNILMPSGPDHTDYQGPTHIFSGHFHKRQVQDNIIYIGNTFPTTFGDAGDSDRGMMIYDHNTQKTEFINWDACPKYIKTKLTDLLDENAFLPEKSRVKCIVDVPISFEETAHVRQEFIEMFNLREFTLEESYEIKAALTETQSSIDPNDIKLESVDDLVLQMLRDIKTEHISNEMLVEIYRTLKT